ncbi:hypothetical protein L6164_001130 [Bauhinia variegata]|uniref:Uncharacterized protein n=1 Tax=Bauhinia variegata TaxID=167791 RepID=A0ACB9Q8M7_BAUVA|nr:hypothetical protein L6164_001130 [Bauhinia variegata]
MEVASFRLPDTYIDLPAAVADLRAARERDPACVSYSHCLLNYKGFLACQAHLVGHRLWQQSRRPLALALNSLIADVFAVDIHPAAKIGKGILFDHATGVVVGETAVIGNNVSILHHLTLGGTGKMGGDSHPKIGYGVLIGAGATIPGNVKIGEGAKIGAGSVVLIDVPARTTAVGNPARLWVERRSHQSMKMCLGSPWTILPSSSSGQIILFNSRVLKQALNTFPKKFAYFIVVVNSFSILWVHDG